MYTFNHYKTIQTDELTDYRYVGLEPNNYIKFNNETWRIIGVFPVEDENGKIENRIKIVRNESIGNYAWDISDGTCALSGGNICSEPAVNSGLGINEWSQADLMTLLNDGAYYKREKGKCISNKTPTEVDCDFTSTGISEESKKLFKSAKWFLGENQFGLSSRIKTQSNVSIAESGYYIERSNIVVKDEETQYKIKFGSSEEMTVSVPGKNSFHNYYTNDSSDTVERTISWIGDIALVYPSDYLFTIPNVETANSSASWFKFMYGSSTSEVFAYTLQAALSDLNKVICIQIPLNNTSVGMHGYYTRNQSYQSSESNYKVFPTLYLRNNITITSGEGIESNPYEVALIEEKQTTDSNQTKGINPKTGDIELNSGIILMISSFLGIIGSLYLMKKNKVRNN